MNDINEQRFRREILFEPAYDKRQEGGGAHCVTIRFLLHGPDATTQFTIFTGWWLHKEDNTNINKIFPMAADLGYHARSPQYEGQASMDCQFLPEGRCYYDGSSLAAEPLLKLLIADGLEALWAHMESSYNARDWKGAAV